jgi:hypothetical protein
MKYVYAFLAIIIGTLNFGYAWVIPWESVYFTLILSLMIFATCFGQFAFSKPGEESAVFFLQISSMAFLMLGLGNLALVS